jgi:hypothetical protein
VVQIISFPELSDISILLLIISITLVITSEMVSSYYGKVNIRINKRRLRRAALATSAFFLITIAVRALNIVFRTLMA